MKISIHRNKNTGSEVINGRSRTLARAEETAALIAFVASDDASFATGSEFVADGGVTAG